MSVTPQQHRPSVFGVPVGTLTAAPSDSLDVSLHPMMTMSIADHFTAHYVMNNSSNSNTNSSSAPTASASSSAGAALLPPMGVLMGIRQRKHVEVCSAFELIPSASSSSSDNSSNNNAATTTAASNTHHNNNSMLFDVEIAAQKREMLKAIYSAQEVVGWYVIGGGIAEPLFDAMQRFMRAVYDVDGPLVIVADLSSSSSAAQKKSSESVEQQQQQQGEAATASSCSLFPINVLETPTEDAAHALCTALGISAAAAAAATNNNTNTAAADGPSSSPSSSSCYAAALLPSASKAAKIAFSFASSESERIATDMLFRLEEGGQQQQDPQQEGGDATATRGEGSRKSKGGANQQQQTGGTSILPLTNRLGTTLSLLETAIATVINYLTAVKSGAIADPDPDLLRQVMGVCQSLPCGAAYRNGGINSDDCENANENTSSSSSYGANKGIGGPSDRDATENLLIAYAAVIQKTSQQMNHLQHTTARMVAHQLEADEAAERSGLSRGGGGRRGGGNGGGGSYLANAMGMFMGGGGFGGGYADDADDYYGGDDDGADADGVAM